MRDRYAAELTRLLGAEPLPGGRAWRACLRPSFSVECLIEVVDSGPLRVVSPQRQIWAWLQQAGADPSRAWVEPAIADERIELSAADLEELAHTLGALALPASRPEGLTIDGMPVTLVRASALGREAIEGEISQLPEAWQRFAGALVAFAGERVRWEASRDALAGVAGYLSPPA
ncbi:MAG: hypothetical protein V4850_22870 [Myxococcota bacterium]